jgi:hypothetical protein
MNRNQNGYVRWTSLLVVVSLVGGFCAWALANHRHTDVVSKSEMHQIAKQLDRLESKVDRLLLDRE